MTTQLAIGIEDFHRFLHDDPAGDHRYRHYHIIDWHEETKNILGTFDIELSNRTRLRKMIQAGKITFHSNSATPGVLEENHWVKCWPGYDLVQAWQTPHPRTQDPQYLYHSQNRLLRPHRTQLVRQLWKLDRFQHGLVSYTQEQTAEWKDVIPRATGPEEWQQHVHGWLEPYEGYNPDMIHYRENNPPPPVHYWWRAAVNFVTETEWEYANLTEKTYMCLLWGQPLLVLGAPGVCTTLLNEGYLLHDDVFDYKFDTLDNMKQRTKHMCRQVLQYDVDTLWSALKPVAQKNQQIFLQQLDNLDIPSILKDDTIEWKGLAAKVKRNIFFAKEQANKYLSK